MSTLVLGTLQEKPFYIHFTEEKTKTGVPYKWGELALNSRIQIHNGFPTLSINPPSRLRTSTYSLGPVKFKAEHVYNVCKALHVLASGSCLLEEL